MLGGRILLKLAEMAKDDLLNAEAGWMEHEDQGISVLSMTWRKRIESRGAGNRNVAKASGNNGRGASS